MKIVEFFLYKTKYLYKFRCILNQMFIYTIFITTISISIFRVTFLYSYSYMYLISCFLPFAKHTN